MQHASLIFLCLFFATGEYVVQWKRGAVAAWPGGPGGAPTHLPLYNMGRHGHRRAPGGRSMYYQALALDQSSDLIVINLD